MLPPFAHLELYMGDCLEVFFSNLLVYYTRLPSVLPKVLFLDCPLFLSLSRWSPYCLWYSFPEGMEKGIKTCLYFSAFVIPQAEMQPHQALMFPPLSISSHMWGMLERGGRIQYVRRRVPWCHSLRKVSDPKHTANASEIILGEKNSW